MAGENESSQELPLPRLPERKTGSHKYDFGRALIVGGSRGMTGAVVLSGIAALRSGAGVVQVATARQCQPIVASFEPSYLTLGLADDDGRLVAHARQELEAHVERATVLGCGPGLGRLSGTQQLVLWLYASAKKPAVFDADALFALAQSPDAIRSHAGPRILTPHSGEFRVLVKRQSKVDRAQECAEAQKLAAETGTIVLLKGSPTFITDGERHALNRTGNPALATGGTGDVLTGVITAMLAQGLAPFDAARLAAHVHGLAADLAAAEIGPVGMLASDLLRYLPAALKKA